MSSPGEFSTDLSASMRKIPVPFFLPGWGEPSVATTPENGTSRRLQASEAHSLVEQSTPSAPWEKPVQNLLRVLCGRAAGTVPEEHVNTMLTTTLALLQQPLPATAVFRTRAGLTALDLAEDRNGTQTSQLQAEVIATARTDAYAARDALTHSQLPQTMTARHRFTVT